MKKLLIPILFSVTILLQSSSCKKPKSDPIKPVYNKEFPNNTGTFWKYKIYDSIYNIVDTLTVIVGSDTKLNNGLETRIWETKSWYHNTTDTDFVNSSAEGIKIYENRFSTNFKKNYVFPLAVGKTWVGSFTGEVYTVSSKNLVVLIAGTFNDCFNIKRNWRFSSQQVKESEWFLPNLGLIKKSIDEIDLGYFNNQEWELYSYSIK